MKYDTIYMNHESEKVVERMNKSSLQLLAFRHEIIAFVESLRANEEVTIAFTTCERPNILSVLQEEHISDLTCSCSVIYVKLDTSFEKTNSLVIYMGQDDEKWIGESSIGIKGEGIEFEYWKKQISKYKRTLLKGAYVVNPYRNSKTYSKNVYYTRGAKEAFEKGTQMKPIAGWNYYLLEEAQA